MNSLYKYLLHAPRAWVLALVVLAAFPYNQWIRAVLDDSYAASRFPVPYFVQQMSFSAARMKEWYAYMIEQGTMDVYIRTQHIDFAFMLSVLLLHAGVLLLISRWFEAGSRGRKAMVICAMLAVLAPLYDALENLVSYIMLADSAGFPDFLAYLYSSFALMKFAAFVLAYLAAPIGCLWALVSLAMRRHASPRRPAQAGS